MKNYRENAKKVIAIVIVESIFFTITPYIAIYLGVHPYEVLSVLASGILVAYGVTSFFDSISDSKERQLLYNRIEKLEKQSQRLSSEILKRGIENDVQERTGDNKRGADTID